MENIDYKKVLNPSQLEAVMTLDGSLLVVAGAGSGKTRTLIYRVARLIEAGISPEAILLLTFTRKASQEMLDRAAELTDKRCRLVSGGTFHSLALRVLRSHADLIGFATSFTIMDRPDMEEIIRRLIPELDLPKGTSRFPKRGTLANILSKGANLQKPINEFMEGDYSQFIELIPQISRLERLYKDYKKDHNLMDYDDLILNLRRLLAEHIDVRRDLSRQYKYIMVDEYQDTNTIQADIIKWLAHDHGNIMIVGDDSQSIYSFRGANYRNMLDFPVEFSETKVIKLEENYRSTQPILSMTNALMEQAGEKYTKHLFTRREGGERPKVVDTKTALGQAMFICRHIKEQMKQGRRTLSDFAVLFRAGYHSFELEAELVRQGIHYVKHGGFKFLESAHIKDFLAHLKVIANRDDAVSWSRILKLIKNVGDKKSQAIIRWMKQDHIPFEKLGTWPKAGKKESGLKALAKLLAHLESKKLRPEQAVEQVMEYYIPVLKEKFDNYPKRQKELDQLVPMASRYKKLKSFLDDLVLEPPTSSEDVSLGKKVESLTLSTVHSAKGLEWPVVYIIWVMEGRFPQGRAYRNPMELEEERRLMYVATTRAKDQLIMCYPGQESLPLWQSPGAGFKNGLSSFIDAIPDGIISYEPGHNAYSPAAGHLYKNNDRSTEVNDNPSGLAKGDMVRHPAFGPGVISRFMDNNNKVEVLFRNAGRKLLHLKYTNLEKI